MEIPETPKNATPNADRATVAAFANRLILPPRAEKTVVAVSGGADSVCLLRVLVALKFDLVVAHLNHRLRGAESDADADFVEKLAGEMGLPCEIESADVMECSGGRNLENAARDIRYEFLTATAIHHGCEWVATGHTADDQAETIIQRLLRGTGIAGLRGIHPVRELSHDIRLFRPLLDVTRLELRTHLALLSQVFHEDSSNADDGFARNRVRHRVMPILTEISPRFPALACRLARQAEAVEGYFRREIERLLPVVEAPRSGRALVLRLGMLAALDPYLRAEIFRYLWHREGWPTADMTFERWQGLSELAATDFREQHLPGPIRIRRSVPMAIIEPMTERPS